MRLIDADDLKVCYTGTNGKDDKASYASIITMIDNRLTVIDDKQAEKRINILIGKYVEHVATDESIPFELKQYIGALLGKLTAEISIEQYCELKEKNCDKRL